MKVYVVGEFILTTGIGAVWELLGIYTKKKDAIEACIKAEHFVAPFEIDREPIYEHMEWPGCYYPLAKDKPTPPADREVKDGSEPKEV